MGEPFQTAWDVERHLGYDGRDGWRRVRGDDPVWREEDYHRFKKRFGSVWYEILIQRTYPGPTVFVSPTSMRPLWRLPEPEQKSAAEQTRGHVDVRGMTMASLDDAVRALAATYLALAGPRRRAPLDDVYYQRSPFIAGPTESEVVLQGQRAIDGWRADVEAIVLRDILGPRPAYAAASRGFPSTAEVAANVVENYRRVPEGLPTKKVRAMVGSVLESMARRGLIERLTGGERVEWGPREE